MNNEENNMDLLDLDDGTSMDDTLPDASPFATPRPRRPWLLLGVGVLVIVLATYIIIRTIGGSSSSSMDVDLDVDAPVVETVGGDSDDMNVMPPMPTDTDMPVAGGAAVPPPPPPAPVQNVVPRPAPAPQPTAQPEQVTGTPVRVIEDRKNVTFDPNKKDSAPAPKPAAKPATKPAPKPVTTNSVAKRGAYYVQFGSYSTRELADNAGRKMRNAHSGLFNGRQFVVLAANVKGGTLYRLRVEFSNPSDANGFCRNAKSDGLDCYVTK